jgi:hypothetical protein
LTAPIRAYTRGYDGVVYEAEGISFSTPNYPAGSAVIYPTTRSNYYRPRYSSSNPIYTNVQMWIDQN